MLAYKSPCARLARLITRNNAPLHMYEYYPACTTDRAASAGDDDDGIVSTLPRIPAIPSAAWIMLLPFPD